MPRGLRRNPKAHLMARGRMVICLPPMTPFPRRLSPLTSPPRSADSEKYGGKPLTHYTSECKKCNPDGSVKKSSERVERAHLMEERADEEGISRDEARTQASQET
jgi:hypothetical protein